MSAYALNDERLRPLPPSAKLVYDILKQNEGPMTRREISDAAMLPYNTARDALRELTDADVVDTHSLSGDARKTLFSVSYARDV